MRNNFRHKEFTLKKVGGYVFIMVALIIIFLVYGFTRVLTGDFWVHEKSALKAVQIKDPAVIKVIQLKRNFWTKSSVVVMTEKGEQKYYYIDSNIFQNVEVTPIPKKGY